MLTSLAPKHALIWLPRKPTLQLVEVHNFTLAMRNSDTDIKNSTLLPCSWLQNCVTARLLFSYASAFGSKPSLTALLLHLLHTSNEPNCVMYL